MGVYDSTPGMTMAGSGTVSTMPGMINNLLSGKSIAGYGGGAGLPPRIQHRLDLIRQQLMTTGTVSDEALAYLSSARDDLRNVYHFSNEEVDRISGSLTGLSNMLQKAKREGTLGQIQGTAAFQPLEAPFAGFIQPGEAPSDVPLDERLRQQTLNFALQFMDPQTQKETAEYLARAAPGTFGAYEDMFKGKPNTASFNTQQSLQQSAQNAAQAAEAFNFANTSRAFDPNTRLAAILGPNMPSFTSDGATGGGTTETEKQSQKKTMQDYNAGLNWMREYMRAANTAAGDTRAQRQLGAERLRTLEREAEQGPAAQFRTLAENITNPVMQRAAYESVFNRRAVRKPSGDYKRAGVAFRNVSAL